MHLRHEQTNQLSQPQHLNSSLNHQSKQHQKPFIYQQQIIADRHQIIYHQKDP